jgi:hypothetical protein
VADTNNYWIGGDFNAQGPTGAFRNLTHLDLPDKDVTETSGVDPDNPSFRAQS